MSRLAKVLGTAVLIGAVALMGLLKTAVAQDTGVKPVAAVAIGGVDRLMEDAEYIGQLANNPQLGAMFKGLIAAQTGGAEGLPGVDAKRPAGVVVQTDGVNFQVYGMVPVTKLDDLLNLLSRFGMSAEKDGDVYAIHGPQQTLFGMESNGWFVISMDRDALSHAPSDAAVLEDLAGDYDLAVQVNLQNIPPMFRQLAVAMIQQGMQQGIQRQPGQSEEEFEVQKRMTVQSLAQIQDALNETEEFTVGISLDGSAGTLSLDFQMTVVPGSKAAKQLEANADLTTALAGFAREGDSIVIQAVGKYTPESVQLMKQQLEDYRSLIFASLKNNSDMNANERELVTNVVNEIFPQMAATMEKQGLDLAVSGNIAAETLSIVGGLVVDDPTFLEDMVKDLVNKAKEDNPKVGDLVKLDAETYKDVRFHVLQVPHAEIAKGSAEFGKFLQGRDLVFVIGVGEHAVYYALGTDAVSDLKAALDASAEPQPVTSPFRLHVALKPVLQFALAVTEDGPDKSQLQTFVDALSGGQDTIRVDSALMENGSKARIEIGEGVLKAFGLAIQQGMAGKGAGASPDEF